MSAVLLTHDLGVIAGRADRVAVMHVGEIVEMTDTGTLFANPRHPYTEALFHSLPDKAAEQHERLPSIPGAPGTSSTRHRRAGSRRAAGTLRTGPRGEAEASWRDAGAPVRVFLPGGRNGEDEQRSDHGRGAGGRRAGRRDARQRGWFAAEHRAPGQGLPGD